MLARLALIAVLACGAAACEAEYDSEYDSPGGSHSDECNDAYDNDMSPEAQDGMSRDQFNTLCEIYLDGEP